MLRALSSLLILAGIAIVGGGGFSVWSTWKAERDAREQWEQQVSERPSQTAIRRDEPVATGTAVARLSIPGLKSDWVVVEGAGKSELKRGPGRLQDSAMPGARGNCVIAGHRDTHFRVLRNIKIGDEIEVERGGRTYTYRVTTREVVAPTDTRSLDPTTSATLTLVTCYPFYYVGPAPKRFVVRAEMASTALAARQ